MNKLAYKIVAIDKNGIMTSPISYLGIAVVYKMGQWAKAKVWKYLFIYKTLKDAEKVLNQIKEFGHLTIIECEVENMKKAIGSSFVPEYRCTRLKPMKFV